jgi:hypothetical protein
VTEQRRVLIAWDYLADGIWWVDTKEEHEAPYPQWSYLAEAQRPGGPPVHRPWRERLSERLLSDLKAWNDSCGKGDSPDNEELTVRALQEQGRELAIRVQNELGTHGWEVLYYLGGRVHRVHPAGSWPVETWDQDLLGYAPPDPREVAEEEARVLEGLRDTQPQAGEDSSTSD